MRFAICLFALLVASAATSFSAAAQSGAAKQDTSADEKAVRALLDQMVSGWAEGSGEKFAAPFAEHADYVVVNGMHLKGREAIARGHQQIFDTFYKGTKVAGRIESVRFLRPDVALMHVAAMLPAPGEAADPNAPDYKPTARITIVAVKEGGKWQIEAFQNTPIQAPAGAPQPGSGTR